MRCPVKATRHARQAHGGRLSRHGQRASDDDAAEFENGYWYATRVRDFLPSASASWRESCARMSSSRPSSSSCARRPAVSPTKRALRRTGVKDIERGLTLISRLSTTRATVTKDFIVEQAHLIAPDAVRSPASVSAEPLARGADYSRATRGPRTATWCGSTSPGIRCAALRGVRSAVTITRRADFLKAKRAPRADAIAAWEELASLLDAPKDYARGSRRALIEEALREPLSDS